MIWDLFDLFAWLLALAIGVQAFVHVFFAT
jgi:hypothetical protein